MIPEKHSTLPLAFPSSGQAREMFHPLDVEPDTDERGTDMVERAGDVVVDV
jgi:hypothetical protein